MDDIFFDCRSDSEMDRELATQRDGILKKCTCCSRDADCSILKKHPIRYDDPRDVRHILERAATNAQILLRGLGGKCSAPACLRNYPATLELSARLHTDSSCECPPQCRCVLRGSPVTLKLPLELNPANAQIKVNIFRPKPMTYSIAPAGVDAASGPDAGLDDSADGGAITGSTRNIEAGIVSATNSGGAGDRRGSSVGPSSIQRQTHRRTNARTSGRRVRWPDA